MKQYLYNYQTIVSFSEPVKNHAVLLRMEPYLGNYMTIDMERVIFSPGFNIKRGMDTFGNRIVYGLDRELHSTLAYVSTGIVSMQPYQIKPDRLPLNIYLMDTTLTRLKACVEFERTKDVEADALFICEKVHQMMAYESNSTTVNTTAEEAFNAKKGVCQDFAHVMIGLCKNAEIPARYACGFLEGTGQTHAWVEVFDGYNWIGLDPTHNKKIDYGYLKIAHGRDASDCPVSRGIYNGLIDEKIQIQVTLKEL